MKKRIIIISVILLLVVIILFMFIPENLSVNSINIPSEITNAFKEEIRSLVFSELSQKYSVTDTSDFWNMKFPEGKAEEILKNRAEEKAIEYTIKLQLCTGNVNYKQILTDFKNENIRLQQAMEKGEIVYGNTQYTLITYLKYILSENERIYKSQYSFSDTELHIIYDANKELFKLDDIVTVKRLSFPYYVNGQFDESLYFSQKEKAEAFAKNADLSLMKEQTFTYEDSKAFPKTYQYAMDMNIGEISELIYDEASFEIIQCIGKENAGYMDFETVKQYLIRIAEEEKYNNEVLKMLENAKISSPR